MTLWPKNKCEQERNSVGFWRGGLGSREDWMLHFRTCCKASGYRHGWQCQSRIHASNSTLPSGHSSSSSRGAVKVWPQQEQGLPGQPAGSSAPPERAALLPWSSAAGSHPLVLPGWPWQVEYVSTESSKLKPKNATHRALFLSYWGTQAFLTPNLIIGLALSMCARHKSKHLYDLVL